VFQRASDGASAAALRHAGQAIMMGTLLLSILVAASTALAMIIGEPLIVMFTSPAYRASGPYLAPLVLGLGLLQIGHMLSLVPLSSNRLKGHLVVRIVHGSFATVLNVLGARHFGVAGLCGASIVGGALYVILALLNNARIMRSSAWISARPSAASTAAAMTLDPR
jgi:O-antigen/teichoic acid export membrane protein